MHRTWHLLAASFLVLSTRSQHEELQKLLDQARELERQRSEVQTRIDRLKMDVLRDDLKRWGWPALRDGEVVVQHAAHALVYSEAHEQALWTAHIVTPEVATGGLARIDSFKVDPLVPTGTAVTADYWNSGYDRGHLVPSADMRWTYEALYPTYYYSNVSPQLPELNRESWADLEDWVRRSVTYTGRRLYVVTGPVLETDLPKLNNPGHVNEVSIPRLFYKVVADLDGPEKKGIAFVMRNGANENPTISYAVPIDSVEKLTGLDFFHALDDEIEARIESMRDPKSWYGPGDPFFKEVEPLKAPLPKGLFNTVQAKYHVGKTVTVCGTVVSSRKTAKAKAIYLNFDRQHPHQDFYATIWEYNGPNFSYDPETYLVDKRVCVTGKVSIYDDIPRISVNNENGITFFDELVR
ncbi:MAG: DNA/RNA non-specific endonuclease [Flavobacteriales bacterium]|nr:DNA/RNA non-specific endonuclease [Flavobacteriales bacterium]